MNLTDRLKGAIARLERANRWYTIVEIHHEGGLVESAATEAQLDEEFEHGYASGFSAGRADMDKKLRDLIADISIAAGFIDKDLAGLPEHVLELRRQALKWEFR